jgi:hypothetical protein
MKKKSASESGLFRPRIFLAFTLCSTGILLAMFTLAAPAPAQRTARQNISTFQPIVSYSVANAVSARMRDLPLAAPSVGAPPYYIEPLRPIHPRRPEPKLPVQDPVQQTSLGAAIAAAMPAPIGTFEGMNQAEGCGNCIPPDPNGAVGPNHYAEMVNSSYSIYTKTGTRVAGPTHINLLFQVLPSTAPCKLYNDGDPIVVYDHLADRWILSQFAVNRGNGPYDECVAVSQTSDPTGAYYIYDFHLSDTVFHDYPHLGIWPDAYYMTTNQFSGAGQTFSGAGAFAFERDKMLAGQPARVVFFDEGLANSSFGGMLPSYLDGPPPPAGSPNYFAEVDSIVNSPSLGADAMRIWKFHVDWSNTANSTFGSSGQPDFVLPVASWNPSQCIEAQGTCVPQMGSPYQLDVIGDRIMHRLAYRNFGDHEALVINHSVIADVRIGVRWYEVRNTPPGAAPVIFQQGTFAPLDALYRWMGSAAMDRLGNIAVGYSTSSATTFPSIAYAGRLPGDPPGQLSQGETQMFAGLGSEFVGFFVPPVGRWGDYTALTIDPSDGCTFWYVNEYFPTQATPNSGAPWRTRIGSFKFANCVAAAPAPISAVSSKFHGTNPNPFKIDLLPPAPAIECRRNTGADSNGPNQGRDHQVVITFPSAVRVGGVSVASSDNNATADAPIVNGAIVTVNLHKVGNPSRLTITLTNVNDFNSIGPVSVSMNVLAGDTNADARVNVGDSNQTASRSGQVTDGTNFPSDVNLDGRINVGDTNFVAAHSGDFLP